MKKSLLCLLMMIIEFNCGVVDTTDTGITSRIYNPDGTAATSAKVSIFQTNDTTRTPLEVVTTDNNGAYELTSTKAGKYNLWAEKEDLVAYHGSIYLSSNSNEVNNDTLMTPVSFTAFAGLQPNHDPRTVTVQVLGTYKYSNVQQGGTFTIDGMAAGSYTLRLASTLSGYTPTYQNITVNDGKNDTLTDTINLIYTGIPVISNLIATYDTVNGVVNLRWTKTAYWDFQDYLIFRDLYSSVNLSTNAISWQIDTAFSDTVFNNSLYSAEDTNSYHLKYRVAIRNNALEQGITYRFADVVAVSPVMRKMRFYFTPFYSDSVQINSGVVLVVKGKFTSPVNTAIVSVAWKDLQKDSLIKSREFAVSQRDAYDTLSYLPPFTGSCSIECAVTDSKNTVWKDTVFYKVLDTLTGLPLDTSVFPRYYYCYGYPWYCDTVMSNTQVPISGRFVYPSLKTITWTDVEANSIIASDSLRLCGSDSLQTYQDSVSYGWATSGIKRITCTVYDFMGRSLTDTIQLFVQKIK